MSTIVETAGLSVHAGAKALLQDVSLSIAAGESVSLVGPNGAGKTTLLRTLSGEISPTAGTILLKGREPRSYKPRVLALHRAVLAQHVDVAFPFTVAEVVRMGAGEQSGGAATDALVERALAEVDLIDMRERIIGTLSGGEQQRAHLARVLVQLQSGESRHGPGVLLLDEPTASLDLCHQLDLLAIVQRRLTQGTTVITTLHDLNLAALFARRIIVLKQGRLAAQGSPGETITDDVISAVFGVTEVVNRLPTDIPFVLPHQARRT